MWNPYGYEGRPGQTYEPISDYERFILASDRQHTNVYVRSDMLSSEISELCHALRKHVSDLDEPLTFEFDENGQHFEARVDRDRGTQTLFIRLAAQFHGDSQRYCFRTFLHEAQWSDPFVGQRVIPGYEQGKYCVLSQKLFRLRRYERGKKNYILSPDLSGLHQLKKDLWNRDGSYDQASDPDFQQKMALFQPVSLDLIF